MEKPASTRQRLGGNASPHGTENSEHQHPDVAAAPLVAKNPLDEIREVLAFYKFALKPDAKFNGTVSLSHMAHF